MIRRAVDADIPELDRLLFQVHQVHHEARPDLFKAGAKKYTDAQLKAILADDKTPVFVAERGGAVVGYVCDRYLRRNLLSALLMSLGCLIFCQGVLFLVQVFLGHVGFGAGLLPVLRQIGLSLLAAPPVYLAAWLIRKAGA